MKLHLFILSFLLLVVASVHAQAQGGDALDNFVKAERLRQGGNYQDALQEYDKAIGKDASNSKFYFQKGKCYIHLGNEDEAMKAFENAVEVKKDYVEVHNRLAKLYTKHQKLDPAIKSYDNAYKYDNRPEKQAVYKLHIISLLLKNDRFAEAGNHITDALKVAPDNLDVLYFSANFNNESEKYEEAKQNMLKATGLLKTTAPKEVARYYYELGRAHYNLGEYDAAAKVFTKARYGSFSKKVIRMTPQYHHSLAKAYFMIYELDKSKELVEFALKMRPDYSSAHDLLVQIATARTDKSQVIDHLKTSISTEKVALKQAGKYAELAKHELEGGRYEDAIKSAQACLAEQPKNYAVGFLKAIAQNKLGKSKESIATLENLLGMPGIDPDTKAKFNLCLGLFYKKAGDKAQAAERFKAAYFLSFKYAARDEYEKVTGENK